MEEILIQNGSVVLRSVNEIKRIKTEDLYSSMAVYIGTRTPILPERAICYASKESRILFVTHEAPESHIVKVDEEDDIAEYQIKTPHIYFFHRFVNAAFDDLYVYCSNTQVKSAGEILCKIPLKNIYGNGRVCMGNDIKFDLTGTVTGKIARVENHFWNSTFNSDLDSAYTAACPSEWSDEPLVSWRNLSVDDSFEPCSVNWQKYKTFSEVIDEILVR
jgi:hypothetical protein